MVLLCCRSRWFSSALPQPMVLLCAAAADGSPLRCRSRWFSSALPQPVVSCTAATGSRCPNPPPDPYVLIRHRIHMS
ncbi:hypothetical protein HID58_036528 [Brassica napus]|uniref:Secreted protein n=1 Tax=Brassica napus TaxID=3708 RepID=A0ABQ8C8V1_BRANA|nr:hypothetical protein HID58_036528 [Brassica napus]